MTEVNVLGNPEQVQGAGGFAKRQVTIEEGLNYDKAIFQERVAELHGLYLKETSPEIKNQIAAELNYFNDRVKDIGFKLQSLSYNKLILSALEKLSTQNKSVENVDESEDFAAKFVKVLVEVEVPIDLARFEDCGDDEGKIELRCKNIIKSNELLSLVRNSVSAILKD